MLTVLAAPERNVGGALGKNVSPDSPEKPSRAELELLRCLDQGANTKLLKSYCCAWQRDILVQGHLYVTATCFCFYSNILGWETKVCLRCPEITAIVQCKTAMVIPNAITISVKDKKYVFTSFIYRDKVYQNLFKVWQNALLNYPYPPEQLLIKSSPKHDIAPATMSDGPSNTTMKSAARKGSHTGQDEQPISRPPGTDPPPDHPQEDQCSGEGTGQRLSVTSDRTEASTVSLVGEAFEGNDDSSSANAHTPPLVKKVDVGLQVSSSSVSNAVTCVVVVFIVLLVISMLVQLCRLSQVEPHLHFLLRLQPWCQCNNGNLH